MVDASAALRPSLGPPLTRPAPAAKGEGRDELHRSMTGRQDAFGSEATGSRLTVTDTGEDAEPTLFSSPRIRAR
jgi:hypothetical protein